MSGNTNYGLGTSDTTGTNNTSLGVAVLSKITSSAENNTGVGAYSLANNTDGISNVAVGSNSLLTNTSGDYNTALGTASLIFNTTGSSNVALGSNSLQFNTVGSSNVGSGTQSLYKNTTGDDNTSIGTYSQYNNTSGSYNVSLGSDTLYNNTSSNNTAIGYGAMYLNKSGTENVALGTDSLNGNTGGSYNVALGVIAGSNNINGNYNTFVGYNSGSSGSTGSYSTAIGYNSKFSGDHQIVLGTTAEIVIVPGVFQLGSTSGNVSGVTGSIYYNPNDESIYTSNGNVWMSTSLTVDPVISPSELYTGGATISKGIAGPVLKVGLASSVNPGAVGTGNQTFAGTKRFVEPIGLALSNNGATAVGATGGVYYDPTVNSSVISDGYNWIPQFGVKGVTGVYIPGYTSGVTLTNALRGGFNIQLGNAGPTFPGVVTTNDQIFAGSKRFVDPVELPPSNNGVRGSTGAIYYNPVQESIYASNGNTWMSTSSTVQPTISATDLYPGGATFSRGLTGPVLQMGFANATNPGLVSTANQTFAGVKTFSGGILSTTITNSTIGNSNTITLTTTPNISAGGLSYVSGNQFTIGNGTIVGAAKTFIIDHPTDKEKYLVHGCLEGPEAGVYYRGTEKITNGESVSVTLPSYVEKLAHNFTVQVTPIYNGKINTCNVSRIKEGQFTVYGENCEFDWIVCGTRERINAEPKKTEVVVKGDGPYKYIV